MTAVICIPFRDRGTDPARAANLKRVLDHWREFDCPVRIFDDGRDGDEQFCRSAAYNRAARGTDADILVYTESDMLLDHWQIKRGIVMAEQKIGLVVPFTQYRYLSEADSERVRAQEVSPEECKPELILDSSIGAVNIVSRETLATVGQWDENFDGAWWDDRAMHRAFEVTCGATRFADGPAYHLYHLPGWKGDHLTNDDRDALAHNETRYRRYLRAKTPDQIRKLTTAKTKARKRIVEPEPVRGGGLQVVWDNPANAPTKRWNIAEDPTGRLNRKLL